MNTYPWVSPPRVQKCFNVRYINPLCEVSAGAKLNRYFHYSVVPPYRKNPVEATAEERVLESFKMFPCSLLCCLQSLFWSKNIDFDILNFENENFWLSERRRKKWKALLELDSPIPFRNQYGSFVTRYFYRTKNRSCIIALSLFNGIVTTVDNCVLSP